MFRKLLLPLAATALLAGCVTSAPYGYRGGGQGDYYYGSPSVQYRYGGYGGYGGYGYPYSYGPYRPGFSIWGSYGYPYYSPFYGSPHYRSPHGYPHPVHRPQPGGGSTHTPDGAPWRNLDDVVRRRHAMDGSGAGAPATSMPELARPGAGSFGPSAHPRDGGDGGSPMRGAIHRARHGGHDE